MEPKRLFDGGGSEIERMLVSAGRSVRPSRVGRWRTGLVFALANARASARSALRPGERHWVTARWAVVGVTTTALAWGTAQHAHDYMVRRATRLSDSTDLAAPPEDHRARQMTATSQLESQPLQAQAPLALSEPVSATPATVSSRPAQRAGAAGSRSIAREVDELDSARRLIASGDGPAALERLDEYAKLFPKGVLQQEATLLRAEALVASGDRERAKKVAQRALVLYPHSAHAQRFQSLADMR